MWRGGEGELHLVNLNGGFLTDYIMPQSASSQTPIDGSRSLAAAAGFTPHPGTRPAMPSSPSAEPRAGAGGHRRKLCCDADSEQVCNGNYEVLETCMETPRRVAENSTFSVDSQKRPLSACSELAKGYAVRKRS